jgi:hypothetical protein
MRKVIYIFCLVSFLSAGKEGVGQVSLQGPVCVTGNTTYLYTIAGVFDTAHTWALCITGGHIEGSDSSCVSNRQQSFVKVSWDSNGITGALHLTSDSGNADLQVNITTQLTGGTIDENVLIQVVDSADTPAVITCSLPSGGGCSPAYDYQWQRSSDNLQWTDLQGATNSDLEFSNPVAESGYYRRRTKTRTSDAKAYTQVAAIFIKR